MTLDELIGYGNVIGMRWTPEEAQEVLNTIDKNSDGKLSLEEWISFTESEVCDASSTASDALRSVKAFINVSLLPSDRVEAIKALYAAIDVNGDGAIDDEGAYMRVLFALRSQTHPAPSPSPKNCCGTPRP